jgi:hypothetical protein
MEVSDIKYYKSQVVSSDSTNGGLIGFQSPVVSGVKNSVFPRVSSAERVSGILRYRKLFLANRNAENETLADVRIGLLTKSPADDIFAIAPAGRTDTQAESSAYTSWYGAGTLDGSATAGSTAVSLLFESDNFADDFTHLYITDGENYEVAEVASAEAVGNLINATLSAPLVNSYSAGDMAAVLINLGTLSPSAVVDGVSSVSGSVDDNYLSVNNIGCADDTFTLLFTSDTAFAVSSEHLGSITGGSVSALYAPLNPVTAQPLFTLSPSFFSGVFQAGESITISTTGAYAPFWLRETVPAGAGYEPSNSVQIIWIAE